MQTVSLYRCHSKHQYSTIQGLCDSRVLLRKKAVHREGKARRYSAQRFCSNVDNCDVTPRIFPLPPTTT